MTSLLERFKRFVMLDGECLVWTGHVQDNGRGEIKVNGRYRRAHRVAYELLHGKELPAGLRLVQTCKTFECVYHWRVDRPWKKLSAEDVEAIRRSMLPQRLVAEKYGITKRYVKMISAGHARQSEVCYSA